MTATPVDAADMPERSEDAGTAHLERYAIGANAYKWTARAFNVVRRMLSSRAKRVIEARDGEEALELIGDELATIDLLVTDLVMPRMGGLELARRLAAERPDLPALFLSGYPDDEVDFEREPLERHRFLQKPFTERDLASALDVLLDGPVQAPRDAGA